MERPRASLGRVLDDLGSTLLELDRPATPAKADTIGGVVIHDPLDEPVLPPARSCWASASTPVAGDSSPPCCAPARRHAAGGPGRPVPGRAATPEVRARRSKRGRRADRPGAGAPPGPSSPRFLRIPARRGRHRRHRPRVARRPARPATCSRWPTPWPPSSTRPSPSKTAAPASWPSPASQDEEPTLPRGDRRGPPGPRALRAPPHPNSASSATSTATDRPVVVNPQDLGDDETTVQRVAIAVRAGDEVLGSIWAAMDGEVDGERTRPLLDASKLVALHLLRLRAGADVQRRLRTDLSGHRPGRRRRSRRRPRPPPVCRPAASSSSSAALLTGDDHAHLRSGTPGRRPVGPPVGDRPVQRRGRRRRHRLRPAPGRRDDGQPRTAGRAAGRRLRRPGRRQPSTPSSRSPRRAPTSAPSSTARPRPTGCCG